MMKKYVYALLVVAGIWGCKDNADYPFEGENAVYFQLESNTYYWTQTLDSMVYSFAAKGVNEDTLWVRVNLEGNTTPDDRPIKVVVDETKTTAEVGLHYEALKDEYALPGDSVYVNIPVIIYNKDAELENKQVVITLALQSTEALKLGITERRTCRLLVSNMLNKPTYWEDVISWDFGDYSRRKHELCIQVLGIDFPETSGEYYENDTMWDIYGAYMSNYFEDNYPIYDEKGAVIEPW